MVRVFFIAMIGFILGALVIENKALYTDKIAQPVAFLPDGGQYDGKLRKGVFDGSGLIIWPYGDRYDGEFKAGLYHGKGRLETAEFIYEGDFFEGIATGEASIRFIDGREYQGDVEAAKANGIGVMTTSDATYRGGFRNNQYHGEGVLIEKTGRRYEGDFVAGVFSGNGQLVDNNGATYTGEFAGGEFSGEGVFVSEAVSYNGDFKAGQYHGQGIYRDQTLEYVGEFVAGEFDGTGRYLTRDGIFYQGGFKQGQFSGKGILNENATQYEGDFVNGAKEGAGELRFVEPINGQDGLVGVWRNNQLVESDQGNIEFDVAKIVEARLYDQEQRLRQALLKVVDHDPLKIDMYFLGIAGDGHQEVFRRDVQRVKTLFDEQYNTQQRSMLLVNSRDKNTTSPLATKQSIEISLRDIAAKMDANQDILFVLLSGYSSEENVFYLEQPGFGLEHIKGDELGALLKSLPVKNKVIVVSSCYAGGFVKPIKDDNTMIVVASAADKKIFNCGGYRQNTVFIETFFGNHLSSEPNFYQAFESTRNNIAVLEKQLGYVASEPLIFRPKAIVTVLDAWREQLVDRQGINDDSTVVE